MASITHKGEAKEIKLDNRTLLSFEMMGGSFDQFESQPITASIKLACAALGLKGDPLDHANDLPSLNELSEIMKQAIDESGFGDGDVGNEES